MPEATAKHPPYAGDLFLSPPAILPSWKTVISVSRIHTLRNGIQALWRLLGFFLRGYMQFHQNNQTKCAGPGTKLILLYLDSIKSRILTEYLQNMTSL